MNNFILWAMRWHVPDAAIKELTNLYGIDVGATSGKSEAAITQRVRLKASQQGARLWRNNVGAYDPDNPPTPWTRWGLCNESAAQNKKLKSSDLIGITPVIITPQHVGFTFGIFTAYELKAGNWKYSGNKREQAQFDYINLVSSMGGIAKFINSEDQL